MPARPEAVAELTRVLTEQPGNPSGAHAAARAARRTLDDARDVLAEVLGCGPGDVVFTGGGTEADNLAVLGATEPGDVVVGSAVEHPAVRDSLAQRQARLAPVDGAGRVDLDALAGLLDEDVRLVSVMLVNNEVGTVQPVDEVAHLVRERAPRALLHTDAVQALSWVDVAKAAAGADLVSVSAHKFGGPKGVGALVVRHGVRLAARQVGGGQERDRRSGTQDVAGVAAMAVAARLTADRRDDDTARIAALRDRLADGLLAVVPDAVETGITQCDRRGRVAGICHVCFPGVEAEALLFLLDQAGIAASAASSCASGAAEPSHVLAAMGVPRELARARCGCRWGGRPPTPTWTSPSRRCPPRWPSCEGPDEGALRHVGRRGLVGHGRPAGRGWPRGPRGHTPALGRRVRPGVLLGGRRGGRPPGRRPPRPRPPRLQLRPRLRSPRGRALRRRPRRRAHPQPLHRVQPAPQVRPAAGPRRRPRLRRRGHRPPRPRRPAGRRDPPRGPGRRRGQGPVLRAPHARTRRRWPGSCFRWGI